MQKVTQRQVKRLSNELPITYALAVKVNDDVNKTSFSKLNAQYAQYTMDVSNGNLIQPYQGMWIKIYSNNKFYADLKFPDTASIFDFIRNHFDNDGTKYTEPVRIEFYEKIDEQERGIDRIFGYNLFYSVVHKGGGKTKTRALHAVEPYWPEFDNWVTDIMKNVVGYSSYSGGDINSYKVIWFPSNFHKMYKGLKNGIAVEATSQSGRYHYYSSWGGEGFEQANGIYNVDWNGTQYYYCRNNCSIWGSYIMNRDNYNEIFYNAGMSIVAVYRVSNGSTTAALVKPAGIDTLMINAFDTSKYNLYGFYYTNNFFPKVAKINISEQYPNRGEFRINKADWFKIVSTMMGSRSGLDGLYKVKLYLKNKNTGYISPLSTKTLVPKRGIINWKYYTVE